MHTEPELLEVLGQLAHHVPGLASSPLGLPNNSCSVVNTATHRTFGFRQ